MSVNETHNTFLNEEELLRIADQKISIKRLEQRRDIFVFRCYTGLFYCDVAKLTAANVVNGVDGEKWIFTCRSNTSSKIPLLPISISIVSKYVGHPVTANLGKLLPIMSNQRMNSYLKELAVPE